MSSAAMAGFVVAGAIGGVAGLLLLVIAYLIARYSFSDQRYVRLVLDYWWIPPAGLATIGGTIGAWKLVADTSLRHPDGEA